MDESYGKRLNRASWIEFKKSWSGYLIARTLCGLATPAIMQVFKGFHSMLSLAEACESAVIGTVLSVFATYLHSRRTGAEALDSDLRQIIEKKDHTIGEGKEIIGQKDASVSAHLATIESLNRKPKRTPEQERHYADVKEALERLEKNHPGTDFRNELHCLRKSGSIQCTLGFARTPSAEMAWLELCANEHLVTRKMSQRDIGAPYPVTDYEFGISPVIESALIEILYPSGESSST